MAHATIIAIVGRNEFGYILFAYSNLFPPSHPTLEEMQAALQAIKLAVFYKYSYVIFEGDFKGAIDTWQYIHSWRTPWFIVSYLLDVKVVLSSFIC